MDKPFKVGFMSVDYSTWLFNMVLVKKANRQWCVCVDFTYLNKVYSRDWFLLPQIY